MTPLQTHYSESRDVSGRRLGAWRCDRQRDRLRFLRAPSLSVGYVATVICCVLVPAVRYCTVTVSMRSHEFVGYTHNLQQCSSGNYYNRRPYVHISGCCVTVTASLYSCVRPLLHRVPVVVCIVFKSPYIGPPCSQRVFLGAMRMGNLTFVSPTRSNSVLQT